MWCVYIIFTMYTYTDQTNLFEQLAVQKEFSENIQKKNV